MVVDAAKLTAGAVGAAWDGKEGWRRERSPAAGKMTPLLAGTLGRVSRVEEVLVWRCRAQLPNVLGSFLKFSAITRLFVAGSLRDRVIIREMNESVFVLNIWETGAFGLSKSCEKVVYPILPHQFTFSTS